MLQVQETRYSVVILIVVCFTIPSVAPNIISSGVRRG